MNVFTKPVTVEVTVTPDNDAYTANDCVGGLLTFAVPGAVSGGIINSIRLRENDNEGAALDLWLFNASPTAIADDAALALAIADLRALVYKASFAAADYTTNNSLKWIQETDVNQVFQADGAGNLYGYLQCTGTPTYAATKKIYVALDILTEQ